MKFCFKAIIFLAAIAVYFAIGFSVFAQTSGSGIVNVNALVPSSGEEDPSGGGGIIIPDTAPPIISDIEIIEISANSARINWNTNELCIPQINYGKTENYTKTFIGASFSIINFIVLENLSVETVYHFEIAAIDRAGNRISSGDYIFKTLSLPDAIPPANVSAFKALPGNRQIDLSWQNPAGIDFKEVRIFRSDNFYPASPGEEILIYTGSADSFIEAGLTNGKRYYYTIFAYDGFGNFSSGAIASAIPFEKKSPAPTPPISPIIPPDIPPVWPPDIPPPVEIKELKLEDIKFFIKEEEIFKEIFPDESRRLNSGAKDILKISIPAEKIQEGLKSIIINIKKQHNAMASLSGEGQFEPESYLLKINKEKTAYEAIFTSPYENGIYSIDILAMNFKEGTLDKVEAELLVKQKSSEQKPVLPVLPIIPPDKKFKLIILLLAMIAGLIVVLCFRRKARIKN